MSRSRAACWFVLCGSMLGCAHANAAPSAAEAAASPSTPDAGAAAPQVVFQAPAPRKELSASEAQWIAACGAADAALFVAAQALAEARAAGAEPANAEQIGEQLRRAGAPYVWPVALTVRGGNDSDLRSSLRKARAQLAAGEARCGLGWARDRSGTEVFVAVLASSPGSLAAVPQQVALGEAATLDARWAKNVKNARAYVLPSDGSPEPLALTSSARRATARFTPARDGVYTLQLVGDTGDGPRPLFEVRLIAGRGASGERPRPSLPAATQDAAGVLARINHLRAQSKLPALRLDKELSALAEAHSRDMLKTDKVAHDVGSGDAAARVKRAGLSVRLLGENVSFAQTVLEAQGGLERSASHHANMVRPEFRRVGLGVVQGRNGYAYLTELFAD